MIIPSPEESIVAISVVFHKPLREWSESDRRVILRRLAEFMRKQSRTKRRRKGTK